MGWIREDHARPAPWRCLGECCSNQQKHAGSPAQLRGQSWMGGRRPQLGCGSAPRAWGRAPANGWGGSKALGVGRGRL